MPACDGARADLIRSFGRPGLLLIANEAAPDAPEFIRPHACTHAVRAMQVFSTPADAPRHGAGPAGTDGADSARLRAIDPKTSAITTSGLPLELPCLEVRVDSRVRRTIQRMEEQLHRRLTVTELAAAAGLSVAQLTRLFRQTTGHTPGGYLQALRMQRARVLVERTSLPVTEVMVQVGIFDRSHFTRAFCRVHGVGPRTLRVQLRLPRVAAVDL